MKITQTSIRRLILLQLGMTMFISNNFAGEIDTTKTIFILDGKRVTITRIIKDKDMGKIKFVKGANSSRESIKYFGEKYRYGIYIYVTKKMGE